MADKPNYDLMVLLDPEAPEERRAQLIGQIRGQIESGATLKGDAYWGMRKLAYEPAPLVLAFVLGPLLETALRRSLIQSDGSLLIFLQRPISAAFIVFSIAVLIAPLFSHIRLGRGLSEED